MVITPISGVKTLLITGAIWDANIPKFQANGEQKADAARNLVHSFQDLR